MCYRLTSFLRGDLYTYLKMQTKEDTRVIPVMILILIISIGYEQFKRLLTLICLGVEIAAHCDHLFKLRFSKISYVITINRYYI